MSQWADPDEVVEAMSERPGDWSVEDAEREQERPPRPGFSTVAEVARELGYTATAAGYTHVGPNLMGEAVCRNPLTGSAIHVQETTPEEAIDVLFHLLTRRRIPR